MNKIKTFFSTLLKHVVCRHLPVLKHAPAEGGVLSFYACYACGVKLSPGILTGERSYHLTQH